jgi:hypothetical protein
MELGSALPAPRTLLTSLFDHLTSQPIPAEEAQATSASSKPGDVHSHGSTNPLALLPPSSRTLLTTLHVIYPSLLLPSLDLLDRGLVTRIVVLGTSVPLSSQSSNLSLHEAEQTYRHDSNSVFHLVRSAQQPTRRGRRPAADDVGAGGGPTYVVRTRAWSCDCATFAFGAFPVGPVSTGYYIHSAHDHHQRPPLEIRNGRWEFGGLSFDGRPEREDDNVGSGTPPCCKHLLACVLAERWGHVLGGYVQERKVGPEEAAGLIGGL